jgi:hypothetical protein
MDASPRAHAATRAKGLNIVIIMFLGPWGAILHKYADTGWKTRFSLACVCYMYVVCFLLSC